MHYCLIFAVFILNITSVIICVQEDQAHWHQDGLDELKDALNKRDINRVAKNVIIFVGDGMGPTTVTTSRIYGKGEAGRFAFEKFTNVGILKTYSANKLVPDSCSTATALFCGIKANHKTSGVDATVELDNCEAASKPEARLPSIFNWAQAAGKSTGFATTTRVTHATPSALYAHTPNRNWECEAKIPANCRSFKDIARQLVEDAPGRDINVIFGGGRQCLQSNVSTSAEDPVDTWSCYSTDGRDLIGDWTKDKIERAASYQLLESNEDLQGLDLDAEFTMGIFANGHLKMNYERDSGPKGMPSLADMTEKAIQLLDKNPAGYVLMVEGGLIDFAHHRGHAKQALDETLQFNLAIEATLKSTNEEETLIIVTADHAHSLIFTGYPDRGSQTNVLDSLQSSVIDGQAYTPLLYGTGGANNYQFLIRNGKVERADPKLDEVDAFEYSQQSLVLNDEVTHSGTDVVVYANGPMAHLFTSVHEQSYVAYVISYAAKIGPAAPSANKADSSNAEIIYKCNFIICSVIVILIYFV